MKINDETGYMPQLRLTQKFAKDLKLKNLNEFKEVSSLFDDWVVDVVRVNRKKIAMVTHVKSLLTFFIPYQSIGGAKNIPQAIGVLLSEWIANNGYSRYYQEINELFNQPFHFCKTSDRKVLGHMNDFKRCASFTWCRCPFDKINWIELADDIADMPVTTYKKSAFSTPKQLLIDVLRSKTT